MFFRKCWTLVKGIDAHGLKFLGEGRGGFCQTLGGRVYRGCENFGGRVHLFGVLLHFYFLLTSFAKILFFPPHPPPPLCASMVKGST